jgi:hypothetical protein
MPTLNGIEKVNVRADGGDLEYQGVHTPSKQKCEAYYTDRNSKAQLLYGSAEIWLESWR